MPETLLEVRDLSLAWGDATRAQAGAPTQATGAPTLRTVATTRATGAPTAGLGEVSTSYVFQSVTFSVQAGDCLWVSGPSGCGKTSLLRSLVRLEPKAEGDVLFRGESARGSRVPAFRRAVVYAAQTPARYPLSVEEAFAEVMEFAGSPQTFVRESVAAWCARLQLPDNILSRRISELSGGELKRMQVVRSLLAQPAVLVLDEPAAGLDEVAGRALYGLLFEWLSEAERALIIVSHDAPPEAVGERMVMPKIRKCELKLGHFEEVGLKGAELP